MALIGDPDPDLEPDLDLDPDFDLEREPRDLGEPDLERGEPDLERELDRDLRKQHISRNHSKEGIGDKLIAWSL